MKVVNLAVKREDGKVEQDTFFTDRKIDQKFADEIAQVYNCDVIISVIGSYRAHSVELQKASTYHAQRVKTEVDNA